MQLHRTLKVCALHVLERAHFDDPGIIDQDIDAAEMPKGRSHRFLDLLTIEQIARDRRHIAAVPLELVRCATEFIHIARKQCHATALPADLPRQDESQTARSSRDEADFAGKGEPLLKRAANRPAGESDAPERQS